MVSMRIPGKSPSQGKIRSPRGHQLDRAIICNKKKSGAGRFFSSSGRAGGSRTHTDKPGDFKSPASANSATAPRFYAPLIVHSPPHGSRHIPAPRLKRGCLPAWSGILWSGGDVLPAVRRSPGRLLWFSHPCNACLSSAPQAAHPVPQGNFPW